MASKTSIPLEELLWVNLDNSLFDISGESHVYIPYLNISKVLWLSGDPRSGVRAVVTISELLGGGDHILNLTDGFAFEVLHREYGPPDEYVPGFVIARFSNGVILSKWVEDLVIDNPNLSQVVSVFCQIRADFLLIR